MFLTLLEDVRFKYLFICSCVYSFTQCVKPLPSSGQSYSQSLSLVCPCEVTDNRQWPCRVTSVNAKGSVRGFDALSHGSGIRSGFLEVGVDLRSKGQEWGLRQEHLGKDHAEPLE